MNSKFLLMLWSLIPLLGPVAQAGEGGGVGNGGSGYRCGDSPAVTSEFLLANRFSQPVRIEDRDRFMERVLSKIKNETFKTLLYSRWLKYGDSEFWPEQTLIDDHTTVYYYLSPRLPVAYSRVGLIPPEDPSNGICATPMYEPSKCCERALLSFFYPKRETPTKIKRNYDELTRYQKNLLELHEAVYRLGFDLAGYPLDHEASAYVTSEIAKYRHDVTPAMVGELPSVQVMSLVAQLISETSGVELDTNFMIDVFWAWSQVTRAP